MLHVANRSKSASQARRAPQPDVGEAGRTSTKHLTSIAPSGAHAPDSKKSYPFGEPIDEAIDGAHTFATPRSITETLPHIEFREGPDFYFIEPRDPVARSPVPEAASVPTRSGFDVELLRRDFPVLNQRVNGRRLIWLDNAATTQKPNSVINSVSDFYRHDNSNIHRAAHTLARRATDLFEAGTPDIAGVVGLAAAIDYLTNVGIGAVASYEHALVDYAANALATVPGLRPIGTAVNKASVVSFIIPGIPIEDIARHLDYHGIAIRAGHHCALPAHRHFGLEGTVRPSLAFYNTYDEVDALVQVLHGLRS
jgi:hypothetical protein